MNKHAEQTIDGTELAAVITESAEVTICEEWDLLPDQIADHTWTVSWPEHAITPRYNDDASYSITR